MCENTDLAAIQNNMERVVLSEVNINSEYKLANLYFKFHCSSNKSTFHIVMSENKFIQHQESGVFNSIIPFDEFIDIFMLLNVL